MGQWERVEGLERSLLLPHCLQSAQVVRTDSGREVPHVPRIREYSWRNLHLRCDWGVGRGEGRSQGVQPPPQHFSSSDTPRWTAVKRQ